MAHRPTHSESRSRRIGDGSRARRRLRAAVEALERKLAPAGASISGVVFNDLNSDAKQEAGESGIAGRTVFVDLNRNGQVDSGEPTTTTASNGSYQFTGLAAGTYQVNQVLPSGWKATTPVGAPAGTPYTVTLSTGTTSNLSAYPNYGGTADQNYGPIHLNGYTLNTNVSQPTVFTVFGSSNTARYAGTPMFESEWAPSTISLTRDDGTPFTLNSMALSTIWTSTYSVTVTFTGHKADGTTVTQAFPIGNQLGIHNVSFTGFTNLTSVTWVSSTYTDYHQFTNVSVTGGTATNVTGLNFGSVSTAPPVANNDSYTTNENTTLTTGNPLVDSLTMNSQAGDYIGAGKSYNFGPTSGTYTVSRSANDNYVGFSFQNPGGTEWWYVNLAAPNGAPLTPGTYTGAARYPFQASTQPGLSVYGDGRGSNTLTGQFTVTQAVYDGSGNVLSFAASFEQHSEGATPALTGTITYQSANAATPQGVLANDTGSGLTAQLVTGPAHGALTFNTDGTFQYAPATNYYGPDSFTYTASGGGQTSNVATVNLTVNHVNQPPVAVAQAYQADKNTAGNNVALNVAAPGLLAGASDPDPNTTLTAILLTNAAHGTVTLNADGSFTYLPNANYLGTDTFTYAANDGSLNSKPATVTVTVTGPDDPPAAQDDSYLVAQNATLTPSFGVLANDSDPNGQPITAALVAGPANGTLTLNADGSFTYTPAAGFHGTDSFQYQASDGTLTSNVATATITVDAPPVVVADSYSTLEDQALSVAATGVLANDSQADGNPLTAILYSGPAHGTITLKGDGSFVYTPSLHYSGSDSFQYRVSDGKLTSAPVTDTITVQYVNYAPTAANDGYTMAEGGTLTVQAATTSYTAQSDPNDYIGGGQNYSYGASDATYSVSRNYDNGVSVRIVPVNNPGYSWSLDFAAPGNVPLTPGVYNGATRYPFQSATQPGLSVTYYDRGSNTLTGTFTVYQADYDAKGNVLSFDASYTMHNEGMTPALSGHIRYHAYAGQPGVLFNDSDVENEALSAALVSGPAHGTVNLNADGSFTYTPSPLYYGNDSFTYTANDPNGTSTPATATIAIAHVNHAPTAAADSFRVATGQALNAPAPGVLGNDTDVDRDPITAVLVAGPAHGSLTLNPDGSIAYTPTPGYTGPDSFQYTVNDGQTNGNTVTDAITVDAPPVASNDSLTMTANTTAGLALGASDPENDPLTYSIVSGPANGTLSGTAPNLTYTPATNFVGNDGVTFKVNDGLLDSNVATITIVVNRPTAITPTITWPTPAGIVYGTALGASQLDATASMPGTFTYSPASGTVLGAGPNQTLSVLFTPDDSFDYNSATSTTTLDVAQATPTVAWVTPADIVYGTALGASQLDATASVPGTWSYDQPAGTVLGAGTGQTLSATFTPDDSVNYEPVKATTTINVQQSPVTLAWTIPADITYGTALGAAQLNATASVPGTFSYTQPAGTVLGAGSGQTLSATFTPTDTADYAGGTVTTTINVGKATPTYAWTPSGLTYGTPLGSAQLNATASVVGSFAYTPAAGTVLNAGSGQVLSAVFTPTDTADYNTVNATAAVNVARATPTIVWGGSTHFAITYGTALGPNQLNATATFNGSPVAGTFTYTPASGTVLRAGTNQTLTTSFQPADATDFNATKAMAEIDVARATPAFSNLVAPTSIVYGTSSIHVTGHLVAGSLVPDGAVTIGVSGFTTATAVSATVAIDPSTGNFAADIPTSSLGASSSARTLSYSYPGSNNFAAATATAALTITPAPQTIAWAAPADITYGTALGANQLNATVAVAGPDKSTGALTYSPPAGTVLGVGTQTLTVTAAATPNYAQATQTVSINVRQATPTLAWPTPADITYGTALDTTQLNATATLNGSPVSGHFTYATPSGTVLHAGLYQVLSARFVPDDSTDFNGGTVTTKINVNKATPTVSWAAPAAITFGTALDASQLNATASVPGSFSYAPAAGTVLGAGAGQALSATFTPTDATDYTTATATTTITVNKATPVVNWATPADIVYGATLGASQLNATASVPGSFAYSPAAGTVLQAGAGQVLGATFTPTDTADYTTATATTTITVRQAPVIITWTTPADITYGTALGSAQLNASASVPGTFTYTPAAGTILKVGAGQTLSATFTPTDTTDYNGASISTTINVGKATPVVNWAAPAVITYGTALGASQLNVTGSVPGTFAYTPAAGTVLKAGAGQSLSVTFTPTDTADYTTATATTTITVNKATPTVSWAAPADIVYGRALGATQLNATATVPGSFVYTPAAGTILKAGAGQTLSVAFTPTDTADYTTATATTTLNVQKATPSITWSPAGLTYGTALGPGQLNATASVAGSFAYSPASGTVLHAGTRTLSATFTPTDSADYNTATATASVVVAKAPLVVTPANADMGHGDAVPALGASLSGFVNGDTAASAVTGSPTLSTTATSASAAGSYPITAAQGTLAANDYDFTFATTGKVTVHPKVLDVRVHWGSRTLSLVGLTRDLPFINISAVDVLFSDDVNVTSGDLALTSTATAGKSYAFNKFAYDASKFDATWTLPSALGIDRLMLALDSKFGARVDPTIAAWNNNPLSFAVLPGDSSGDGVVNNSDWQAIKNLVGVTSADTSAVWADLDGNKAVDNNDVNAAKSRTGTKLP